MITAAHIALALAAHVALWRGLERASFAEHGPGPEIGAAFALAVLIASAAGSAAAIVAGRASRSPARAALWDGVTFAAAAWAVAVLSLGPWTRDLAGVAAVAIVVVRLAPGALAVVSARAPVWLAFVVAAGGYMAMAAWLPVASAPFGDQVHYLLVADRLAHGSVATPPDVRLFTEMIGVPPSPADDATHTALTPLGPRPIQGYALALAILPGWVLGGRLGVGLLLALVGAWVSFVTMLILRDLRQRGALPPFGTPRSGDAEGRAAASASADGPGDRSIGWTWLMATAFLPMTLLATHVYPNMLGAALIATAFRWGFTAPVRRPALAAAILALTLFLTPRDAIALAVLLPFLLRDPLTRARVAIASGAVLMAMIVANGLLYGLPVPYASYAFGTAQAQELTRQGSITAFLWVTLPAILFDRTFGLAGTAPWLFIGLIGLVPALAYERRRRRGPDLHADLVVLLPAALAVGVSVVALGFFRLWEGGYAPPARYFVDVLPVWTPFVAIGLGVIAAATTPLVPQPAASSDITTSGPVSPSRKAPRAPLGVLALLAFVAIAIGMSAITSLVLNAAPAVALNSAFDDKIRDTIGKTLGIDPLGWLPSFQPVTADWYVAAYARLVPAVAIAIALVLVGKRYDPARTLAVNASGASEARAGIPGGETAGAGLVEAGSPRDATTAAVTAGTQITGTGLHEGDLTSADPATGGGLLEDRYPFSHRNGAFSHRTSADPHRNGAEWHRNGAKTASPLGGTPEQGPDEPIALSAADGIRKAAGFESASLGARGATRKEARDARSATILFLVVNLLATGLVVVATQQPWLAVGADPVPDSLYRKWLPLALGIATIGTAVVARVLTPTERTGLFRRHYLLYVVPLALMLIARFGEGVVVNGALGAVYLLIGVGFALNALVALWPAVTRLSDRATALQLATVTLATAVVLLPYHRAVMPTASDEPHYLLVTQSLLYDHDLDLANDYAGDRYSAFYPSRLPDIHGVQVGNAIYSIRDLGMPILAVIPYAVAGRIGVLALLCLVGAALALQLYLLARDVGFGPRAAFLATSTAALTHPLFTYTTQIYPELLTALAFVSAARLMRAGAATRARDLGLASVLLGTLPWLSTRAWPIVVGAGLVLAWIALRPAWGHTRALVVRFAAGALPFAALVLALSYLNWRTLGLFLPGAGYFEIREQQPVLTFAPWIGTTGLLFDRAFGLIPRAPVYLLAFVGIAPLLRKRGAELTAIALGSILSFLYIADIAYWWADGSPPSRYAIGSLPLVVLALAGGWELALTRPPWRWIAGAAVAGSAFVAYLYGVLPNIRYDLALDVAATGSSGGLFAFVERATGVDAGRIFPSLLRVDAASAVLAVAWIAVAAALIAVGRRARTT